MAEDTHSREIVNAVDENPQTENDEVVSIVEHVTEEVNDMTLSLTENTEYIENEEPEVETKIFCDEGDGKLKRIIQKIGCGLKQKSNKEDIEPYSKSEENWTYSKICAESGGGTVDADDDDEKSEKAKTKDIPKNVNLTESDCYEFTFPKRGYLLLVINEKFYNQATRTGADLDLIKMKKVAKRFGFEILNKNAETNLTKSETLNWLEKARTTDHSYCDCFMFMISTHGLEQRNTMKGGKVDHALVCADDQLIFTSRIIEMFNDTNCPSLRGKPKIFIIQACRGSSVDHGSHMNILSSKGKTRNQVKDRKSESDQATYMHYDVTDTKSSQDSWSNDESSDIETPCLICDADMLIMYAIPPGMLAWRNTVDGSWMIHYMHEILTNYDMKSPKSFLKVLTKISAKMALRSTDAPSYPDFHEKKAIPVIEHMLTRDILFASKH